MKSTFQSFEAKNVCWAVSLWSLDTLFLESALPYPVINISNNKKVGYVYLSLRSLLTEHRIVCQRKYCY